MIRNILIFISLGFFLKLPYATLNFRYFIKVLPVAVRLKFNCVSLLIVIFADIFDPRAYCKGDIPTHSFKNRTNLINLATFYYFKESHVMKNGRNDWSVRM